MTIHSSHPFPTPDDPARRLRGRLGGRVSLWTSGSAGSRAGLTVSSLMVANGEPAAVLGLLDPDSDLRDELEETGAAVVSLLHWRHRDLAEVFGGTAPAPGGAFTTGTWDETEFGPRLTDAPTWAGVRLVSLSDVGWSVLATCEIETLEVGDDEDPLVHRHGRLAR
ncbi:flavin reductase family protein [Nocardioides albertanoniae]|uniref:flavin reductase family protein n=1 Tax=Nocardioides albertanoniae TaxID=1175486 RepID=UPI0011525A26|nr:flavin reductase family protein [Nocardioides albertanoniae]